MSVTTKPRTTPPLQWNEPAVRDALRDLVRQARSVCLITPPSAFLLDERVFVSLGVLKVAASLEAQQYRGQFPRPVRRRELSRAAGGLSRRLPGRGGRYHRHDAAASGGDADRRHDPAAAAGSEADPRRPACHAGLFGAQARSQARRADGRGHRSAAQLERPSMCCAAATASLRSSRRSKDDAPKLVDGDDPKGGLFLTDQMFTDGPLPARHLVDLKSLSLQHRRPSRDQPDRAARLPVRLRLLRRAQQQEPAADPQPLGRTRSCRRSRCCTRSTATPASCSMTTSSTSAKHSSS